MRTLGCCLVALAFMLFSALPSWADQDIGKSKIVSKKKLLGYEYRYQGEKVKNGFTKSAFKDIMGDNPEALAMVNSAEGVGRFANVLGIAGGALIGWPIGQSIAGNEDPNWTLAAIGAGLAAVGITFAIISDKKLKQAVDTYNTDIALNSDVRVFGLELAVAPSMIGIRFKF